MNELAVIVLAAIIISYDYCFWNYRQQLVSTCLLFPAPAFILVFSGHHVRTLRLKLSEQLLRRPDAVLLCENSLQ